MRSQWLKAFPLTLMGMAVYASTSPISIARRLKNRKHMVLAIVLFLTSLAGFLTVLLAPLD